MSMEAVLAKLSPAFRFLINAFIKWCLLHIFSFFFLSSTHSLVVSLMPCLSQFSPPHRYKESTINQRNFCSTVFRSKSKWQQLQWKKKLIGFYRFNFFIIGWHIDKFFLDKFSQLKPNYERTHNVYHRSRNSRKYRTKIYILLEWY